LALVLTLVALVIIVAVCFAFMKVMGETLPMMTEGRGNIDAGMAFVYFTLV
jgi:hypothetical protein